MIIAVICLLPIIPGKHTNSPMMPKDLISPGKWLSSCMHHTWIQNFFKGARESEEWFCFLWGLFSRILLCELNKFEFSDPPPFRSVLGTRPFENDPNMTMLGAPPTHPKRAWKVVPALLTPRRHLKISTFLSILQVEIVLNFIHN